MNTISIQCVHCHKRYNAPATMAGKKVKCKHCGKVFAIPLDAGALGEAEAGLSAVGVEAHDTGAPIAPSSGSRVGGAPSAVRDASSKLGAARSRMERNADAGEIDFADKRPAYSLRPSISYAFPGADVIEQITPPIMIVVGLGWLGLVAFQSNNTNAGWVGAVRAVAYVGLSLGLAFPLGYWAIKRASLVERFMLPPKAGIRTLACTSLGFAFAMILWLYGLSVGMLVAGTLVGLVVTLGAAWFLFRLQPREMGNALGGMGAAQVGSVVIAYFVLLGVHTVFAVAMAKSGTNTLDKSPMGPFAWDVPIADDKPKKPKKPLIVVTQPATEPSEQFTLNATQPTTTTAPTTQSTVAQTTDPGAGKPGDPGTAKPVDPANAVAMVPGGDKPNLTTTTTTKPPEGTDGNAETLPPAADSPLVAKATPIAALLGGSQVFFPPQGASTVGVLRRTTTGDEQVEFYTGRTLAKVEAHPDPFVAEKKVSQNYILSPNGDTTARITSFPLIGLQLISTATGKEIKTIPLDSEGALPYLIGYGGGNDAVVILWQRGGMQTAVEVVNTKAPPGAQARLAAFQIENCDVTPSNPVISLDGQKLAIAVQANGEGVINVYDLMSRELGRRRPRPLKVALPKWVPPAGMAWGPNGMLAAYFEIEGNGVMYHFQTAAAQAPLHTHVFRGARALLPSKAQGAPAGATGFSGRTLEFVSPNEWLVFGRQLIDVETGKSLGELGVSEPRAQRVVDKDNLLIVSTAPNGTERLVHVELKPSELLAKRNEARGIKTPSK